MSLSIKCQNNWTLSLFQYNSYSHSHSQTSTHNHSSSPTDTDSHPQTLADIHTHSSPPKSPTITHLLIVIHLHPQLLIVIHRHPQTLNKIIIMHKSINCSLKWAINKHTINKLRYGDDGSQFTLVKLKIRIKVQNWI